MTQRHHAAKSGDHIKRQHQHSEDQNFGEDLKAKVLGRKSLKKRSRCQKHQGRIPQRRVTECDLSFRRKEAHRLDHKDRSQQRVDENGGELRRQHGTKCLHKTVDERPGDGTFERT